MIHQKDMNRIFDVVRNNATASWTVSIAIGVFYYCGYALARVIIRPLIISWSPKFIFDPIAGSNVERVALFNVFESAVVAIPVGIILSFLLCAIFQKKAAINGTASILMFLLMFAILIGLRLSSENDPLWWIRVIKPISAAMVFGLILWLMTKGKVCLTSGCTGSPINPAPGEP
jgi:uncharacterized membrane protein